MGEKNKQNNTVEEWEKENIPSVENSDTRNTDKKKDLNKNKANNENENKNNCN